MYKKYLSRQSKSSSYRSRSKRSSRSKGSSRRRSRSRSPEKKKLVLKINLQKIREEAFINVPTPRPPSTSTSMRSRSCSVKKRNYEKITKLLRRKSTNKNLCKAIETMIPSKCLGDMKVVRYLGGGEFGKVLSICKNADGCKAIKILISNPDRDFLSPEQEINNQEYVSTVGLAPKIHRVCREGDSNFIVMDEVDGVFEMFLRDQKSDLELDIVFEEIKKLLKNLCKYKITHGDLHWGNVGYMIKSDPNTNKSYAQIILIDFGQSNVGKCNPQLDTLQLFRTATKEFTPVANRYNMDYLHKKLFKLYSSQYNTGMRDLDKDIEAEYKRLHKLHEKLLDSL
jgi:tRNA A-37 threonylcarbamoyl transferase component Bud32